MAQVGHIDPNITDEQRANLVKLADYLVTLPSDYTKFGMSSFTEDAHGSADDYAHLPACGTVACAAGHGPSSGVKPLEGETWDEYSVRAFVDDNHGWEWCFGGDWYSVDNTAHGAAARIRYMLTNGIPANGFYQQMGDAPLSYTVPA